MNRWERRIERAQMLEQEYPVAAEFLRFYREIARFQQNVAQGVAVGEYVSLDRPREMPHVDELLALLEGVAPLELAQTASLLAQLDEWDPADPAAAFIRRVLAQAYTEPLASRTVVAHQDAISQCPVCGELPVAAVLRPEGEGGKRSLVCSQCFTEWSYRRLLCPKCGEEDQQRLPVYSAEPFPHVQIEACDTCHTYLKRIDMTRNGLAVPEVDELATLPLDVWAAEHEYAKLQPNLFGL
jgi:FdhE protein